MAPKALPGFRDFFPEEFALRDHIFGAMRRVSRRYGFEEYDGPQLEPLIGRDSGRTRVLVTHDVEGGLDESDLAVGLRGGRQAFFVPAGELDGARARELYA